jgi:formylglycine-generating enzyme required for sulfatase activity
MPIKIIRTQFTTQGFTEVLSDSIGVDIVVISGGKFMMGSPDNEPERLDSEGPQHQVTVSTFCMGQYPITQEQWRVVAGWPQISRKLDPNPSRYEGDRYPVEQVSWYDAEEFCARLSLSNTPDIF